MERGKIPLERRLLQNAITPEPPPLNVRIERRKGLWVSAAVVVLSAVTVGLIIYFTGGL